MPSSWKSNAPNVFNWLEKVQIKPASDSQGGACHVVAISKDETSKKFSLATDVLDHKTKQTLLDAINKVGWKGKTYFTSLNDCSYLLVTITKLKTTTAQKSRQVGIDAAKALKEFKFDKLVICNAKELDSLKVFEGLTVGFYDEGLFKGQKEDSNEEVLLPEKVFLWGDFPKTTLVEKSLLFAKATAFTRLLQDAPANWLTPTRFADIAREVADDIDAKITVLNKKDLEQGGFGAFYSVAKGSNLDAHLIAIEITGENTAKTIALVGKGLTFDAGGISLKPSLGMGDMKYDMSGGAAVLGSALVLGKMKPPVNVVCIIGAVENMPGGNASRPGDIVKARNNKTIEVLNTDAEGRLVLADCLSYAVEKYHPDMMIDAATLTGAVLHGLGSCGAAVMSNDQDLVQYLLSISNDVGEPLWQLPLWPELEKEVKSEVADYANIAKPNVNAGTIIGGMFLKEFVSDTKWAHLDIAGTGWNCAATGYPNKYSSAFALRLLTEACLRFEG